MKTQLIFILFLMYLLNGYSQESSDYKAKTSTFSNLRLGVNTGFDSTFLKVTPVYSDINASFYKWVFHDGIFHQHVMSQFIPMNTLPETVASIISFTATPTNITVGQTATLTPVFDNATSATIIFPDYSGMGPVVSGGAYLVSPTFTMTYELGVEGPSGELESRTVTVNVNDGLTQFLQQGPKLLATNALGNANQGSSVSISADGNTVIVGGEYDNNGAGAAWIWTRNGGNWTQGSKLFGSGSFPPNPSFPDQGGAVSIAADGNTAIVGGRSFAWVWTQIGGIWLQQGPKLDPFIPSCSECQWINAVSISADGNTVILGGQYDDGNPGVVGGAWVWTRAGGVWTQQGPMLIPSDGIGDHNSINSVALSSDGNTAILGGNLDNFANGQADGAAWIWTRSGGIWTQQGPKLIGSGAVGNGAQQGCSVSLSSDGNTAIVGGEGDGILPSSNTGAAWVWTRSAGVWTQQGPKLVGPGGMSASTLQGLAVSLSADGNTAIVGGVAGYSQTSSALIWKRSGDVWTHQGTKLVGSEAMGLGNYQQPGVSISLSADGNTAIVGGWNDNSATGAAWIFNMVITSPAQPGTISGNTSICPSSSQTYSISSVSGATSYTWSLPMGWSGNSTTTSIAAIGGSLGGTISVTANNNSGSSPPSSIDVSIVQVPVQPGVISGDTTVCQDQSGVIYEVPQIANATSYIWSLPDGSSGTSTTNSITVNYSTLAVSGNITVKGTNSCGDGATSTLAIDVLAKPATPAISQLDLTLISSSLLGNQWYNQNGIINGALNQNYTVVSNGTYYAIVTIEGCISEPSNSISIINVGISTNEALNSIMLYPNPVSGALNIENEVNIGRINFEILNAIGQVVCKGNFVEKITVQASSFKPGVYFVKFENGKTCEFKKFFKE